MDVVKCYNRPMDRQISEGCHILSPDADIMLNGKLDHMRPAVGRVVISTAVQSGRRKNRNPGWARRIFSHWLNLLCLFYFHFLISPGDVFFNCYQLWSSYRHINLSERTVVLWTPFLRKIQFSLSRLTVTLVWVLILVFSFLHAPQVVFGDLPKPRHLVNHIIWWSYADHDDHMLVPIRIITMYTCTLSA